MLTYSYSKLIKERIRLFDSILRKGFDLKTGSLWMIEPSQLRFRLGESMKDMKIPYIFGAEDESIIEKAILSLVMFLSKRFDSDFQYNIKDNSLLPLVDVKTLLIEKSYRTDYFLTDSVEKNITCEILSTTPFIDSGILKAWLDPNGYGRTYYVMVKGILGKAVLEEMRLERTERTSFLAILGIINATVNKKEAIIRNIRIKGLTYEKLDQIVGLALYSVFRSSVKAVASEVKDIMLSYGATPDESLMEECFTPWSFLSIQGNIINSDLNPYGIQKGTVSLLKPLYDKAAAKVANTEDMIAAMEDALRGNAQLTEELLRLSNTNYMRQVIGDYLLSYDASGVEVNTMLAELYAENRLIQMLFTDSKYEAKLSAGLEELKRQFQKDANRIEKIDAILEFMSSVKKISIGEWFGRGKKKATAIASVIEGGIAYSFDEGAERFIDSMRELMVDRRGEFSAESLKMEYERGRLYRFSADERPILKELEIKAEGYLFVDMKDFTRKTLRAKEITMADFMESNFYRPILSAASRYGSAVTGMSGDTRNIKLINILGDAVIFAGGLSNLIALAGDIRHIMSRYKEQLGKRVPHIMEEELLRNIHKNFEAMKEDIAKERAEIEKAISVGRKEFEGKALELREKEYRIEKTYREELETAIGQEMEAGLFITYGSKAEVIIMRDNFWGEVNVAVGEKINEAARGTSRNSMIMAKMEMLLEEERIKRHSRQLAYPFDVYVGKTYGFTIPPDLDGKMEDIIVHRDIAIAKDLAQTLANESFKDFRRIVAGETFSALRILATTSDIYNKGQALSEAALNAYIKECRGRGFFFKKGVPLSELHKEIQDAFFFPFNKMLELCFGVFIAEGVKQVEIFCKAGEIIFRGFEAATPTVVYEIVGRNSMFARLVHMHHFDKWYEEAQKVKLPHTQSGA